MGQEITSNVRGMYLAKKLENAFNIMGIHGPDPAAAAGRGWHAGELEHCWRREEQADNLDRLSGHLAYQSGFARIDRITV